MQLVGGGLIKVQLFIILLSSSRWPASQIPSQSEALAEASIIKRPTPRGRSESSSPDYLFSAFQENLISDNTQRKRPYWFSDDGRSAARKENLTNTNYWLSKKEIAVHQY